MSDMVRTQRVRDAVTKTAKLLARDKVEIRQRGGQPAVHYNRDGTVQYVNLPMIPDEPTPAFLDAVQGFLDHEIAHVLFTDKLAEVAVLEPAIREGMNAEVLASTSNIFEDVRIERRMREEYQGSAHNLTKSLIFVLDESLKPRLLEANKLPDARARQASRASIAMVPWVRSLSGDVNADLWLKENGLEADMMLFGMVFPTMKARLAALTSSADAAQLAIDFLKAVSPPPEPEPEPEAGDEGEEDEDEKGEKSKMPSLGKGEDGTSDDDADDDDADADADDGEGDDQDASSGEGAGGSEDESGSDTHKPDKDGDENDGDTSDDDDDEDGDDDGDGDDDDDDGDEDGDEGFGDEDGDDDGEEDGEDGDDEDDDDGEGEHAVTLTEAMKRLDPTQRKLISDYNRKRKTVAQIAEQTGKSETTVAAELKAARTRLNRILEGAE